MKVALFSNYMDHHMLPFCLEMHKLTDGNFVFVATEPTSKSRMKFGYHDMNKQFPFVVTTYDSAANLNLARQLAMDCDVVIWGSCPFSLIKPRINRGKLTFCYSERIFKRGFEGFEYWGRVIKYKLKLSRFQNDKHLLLCSSAYAASDYARMGLFEERAYKWGYFPIVKDCSLSQLTSIKKDNKKLSILWAGRLIAWKHPEAAVQTAEKLLHEGYDFELNIIGSGDLDEEIRGLIHHKKLEAHVHMLGSMSPEEVREHMERADVFLFTSDYNEGWGAVLNEAMCSACAVVASNAIGAVPFLVKDGENGFVYKNGDEDDLFNKLKLLMDNAQLREELGCNAYETLNKTWNAAVAAKELLHLSKMLINGEQAVPPKFGPCSKAEVIDSF